MKNQHLKATEYYESVKHQDTWGVDVVYPNNVENIIEISKIEGILLGLKMCKESPLCVTHIHAEICSKERYYEAELFKLMEKIGASEL